MAKKIYRTTVQDTDYFAALDGITTAGLNTSSAYDVRKYDKKTLLFKAVAISSGCGTFTVQVSPDNSDWYSYDRLIDDGGVDAPVSKVVLDADGQDSAVIPDYVGYIKTIVNISTDGSYSCTLCVSS